MSSTDELRKLGFRRPRKKKQEKRGKKRRCNNAVFYGKLSKGQIIYLKSEGVYGIVSATALRPRRGRNGVASALFQIIPNIATKSPNRPQRFRRVCVVCKKNRIVQGTIQFEMRVCRKCQFGR